MYVVRSKSGRVLRRCATRREAEVFLQAQGSPPSIGKGASGYIQSHHKYAIVGLVPKRGGGFLKTRYVVGRARDAHEALVTLWELTERRRVSGAYGSGAWTYIVLDLQKRHGKLTPTVTVDELERRKTAGMSPISQEPEIISTRKTYDGITVNLHKDGSVSDRRAYVSRSKLPTNVMWRFWGDISLYDWAEIPALIKQVNKLGTWPPPRRARATNLTEAQRLAILASQKRTRWFDPQTGVLMYASGFLPGDRQHQRSPRVPHAKVNAAVEAARMYFGADGLPIRTQQRFYTKMMRTIAALANTTGNTEQNVFNQITERARSLGRVYPRPGKDY